MAPLEPWEKVLVNGEAFSATMHGKMACTQCHGGQDAADKDSAHTGLIAFPSQNLDTCSTCHAEIAKVYPTSLHASQEGYWTVLEDRGASREHPEMQEMFGNHCASCHTSCGDCHVSQPRSVGGGLIDGHVFDATPSMTRNCTACHGSRVGNEYLGKNEGIKADVHFRQGRMTCIDCHQGVQLHGDGDAELVGHRYEGPEVPACKDCHVQVGDSGDQIQMHTIHGEKLACQVCHSEAYTSCDGCHVAVSDKTGNPFFSTEGNYMTFFIGQNPRQDENRPAAYALLRHVPVAPTSFEYYGENLLPNFDALPTWVYATPHNIQRNTPQNASCEACHGNADIFLTADKVLESELDANQTVVVESLPMMAPDGGNDGGDDSSSDYFAPQLPDNHTGLTICTACHQVLTDPVWPATHTEYDDQSCFSCHPPLEVDAESGGS